MMRLLFINSIHPRKFGGGEKWMVKAASGLSRLGHRVFVASKPGAEILKAARAAGVETKVLSIHGDFDPLATWRILRFIQTEKIDLVVCNLNKDVRVAGLACRIAVFPAVIARHGVQLCGRSWKHRITLQQLADGILTNTETIKRAYADYGWFDEDFVHVVYNGIEDKSGVRPRDFQTEYPGKKIVFSAGRLAAQKGFPFLIEAAALLRDRTDLLFLVAGRGSEEAKLEDRVRKRGLEDSFQFLGYFENLDPLAAGCDMFVLPSLFEGMPNAVMEAMAFGKAVILTDVNGARELAEDGKSGIIVPPGNAEALAGAVEKLADDPSMRAKLGDAACRRVRERFTLDAMIGNLETYFETKICEKRNHSKRG
jgi:glycosyltransferase involved in cell wall biosynthesis